MIKNFLNPEGHQNPISGLKVTAILLTGWNLPIGGASSGRVCACSMRSRLVLKACNMLGGINWFVLAWQFLFSPTPTMAGIN